VGPPMDGQWVAEPRGSRDIPLFESATERARPAKSQAPGHLQVPSLETLTLTEGAGQGTRFYIFP
jgi:hypothetical protein